MACIVLYFHCYEVNHVRRACRKIIIPNISIKLAYLLLGELTQILNSSQKVNPLMLSKKKFKYNFSNLDQAITNLRSRLYDNMA